MNSRYLLAALIAILVLLRISDPVEFFSTDQFRQVGYVMDLLHGGDWAIQYEVDGTVATKPPLYNWLAAAVCTLFGTTAPRAMMLPGLLAGLGLLAIIYALAARLFDEDAAFWAALACLSTGVFMKLMWFARTDMLMTFGLYFAIYLVYRMRRSWFQVVAVGAVLAADFLVKGPVGPPLFALWFLLWAWNDGALKQRSGYARVFVGAAIPLAVAGAWLALVWNKPQFQDSVFHAELMDRFSSGENESAPFYYYIPILLFRIAPWSFVAIYAIAASRGGPHWRTVRFVALWTLLFFVFFSVIPSKRPDRLFPVYPPAFLLAGCGVSMLLRDRPMIVRWCAAILGVIFLAASIAVPILMGGISMPAGIWVHAIGAALCGVVVLFFVHGPRLRVALCAAILGLFFVHGLDRLGVGKKDDLVAAHTDLRAFVQPLKPDAAAGRVLVWRAHPLISYELGLHQRDASPGDLSSGNFEWLLTHPENLEAAQQQTPVRFEEKGSLKLPGKRGTISLYRVQPSTPQPAQ